jgi:hypothetical protein
VYEGTLGYEFPNTGIGIDGLAGKVDPDNGTSYGYWNVGGTYSFGERHRPCRVFNLQGNVSNIISKRWLYETHNRNNQAVQTR